MQFRLISLFLVLSFTADSSDAQTWEHAKAADATMAAYQSKNKVPNVAVAVAKNGRILYAKGWMWTDSARPVSGGDRWLFRLASVSKPITAIMALELSEQGKLDLSKPIRDYLPSLPSSHSYMVGDLLSHIAGVRHYRPGDDPTVLVSRKFTTSADALALFSSDPLIGAPGEKYSYSTHAFTIIAAAMENVTGTAFPEYALGRFRSWGLEDMRPETSGIRQPNRVAIYGVNNRPVERDNLSWKFAGGGYEASVRDICKLSDQLLKGQILTRTSIDHMWSARTLNSGARTDYGHGWRLESSNGKRAVSHSGSQPGANSFWRIFPDHGVVVVVLTNRTGTDPGKLADHLSTLAFTNGTPPASVF